MLEPHEKMRWDNDTKDDSGQARIILRMVLLSGLNMRVNGNDTRLSAYVKGGVSPLSDWLIRRKRKKKKVKKRSVKIKEAVLKR